MKGYVEKKQTKAGPRFYAIVDIGPDPETGDRRRRSQGSFRTKKEAQQELLSSLSRIEEGSPAEPSKQTLGEFLDDWLLAVRPRLKASTWASYQLNIERHIKPRLGSVRVPKLTSVQLEAFYAELLESGRTDGKGGLSPKTVNYIHTIIHGALESGVRKLGLSRNVAAFADAPKKSRRIMKCWSAEELRSFLIGTRDDPLNACYLLAATTGMRRAELLGLHWESVDIDSMRVTIHRTLISVNYEMRFEEPKSPRSRRTIHIDPATSMSLRGHRANQLRKRVALGPDWKDTGLVFTQEDGSAVHPQLLSDAFERHVKRLQLRQIRFHDLRHTYATLALDSGMKPWDVSDRLGHSSVAFTLDVYRHAIPSTQVEASNAAAALILGPMM